MYRLRGKTFRNIQNDVKLGTHSHCHILPILQEVPFSKTTHDGSGVTHTHGHTHRSLLCSRDSYNSVGVMLSMRQADVCYDLNAIRG